MSKILASERMRAWSGSSWWALFLIGVPIAVLANIGYLMTVEEMGAAAPADAEITRTLIYSWFTASLFAAVFGARLVTSEYASGAISRSCLVAGRRPRVLVAKIWVSVEVGLVYGLLAVACGLVSALVLQNSSPFEVTWSDGVTRSVLGVIAVTTVSGAWGAFLGFILRNTAVAVGFLVVQALLLEEALFAAVPAIGRFAFTITQQAIYDVPEDNHLSTGMSILVMTLWLLAAGALAYRLFRRRDLG